MICGCIEAKRRRVREHNEQVRQDLQKGDMVKFRRSRFFSHYGIYDGSDIVYHLTGRSGVLCGSAGAEVKKAPFEVVAQSSKAYKDNTREELGPLKPDVIIANAERYLGPSRKRYNWRTFNCETFASMLRYGRGNSKQVPQVIRNESVAESDYKRALLSGRKRNKMRTIEEEEDADEGDEEQEVLEDDIRAKTSENV